MLKIEKIDVSYGQIQILWQVSFDIGEGQIVSLLGSNGAGKTTVAKSISGILPVTGGSIQFLGQNITKIEPYARVQMGLIQIPEGRKIFPTLTVKENLEMGSYLKGPKSHRNESFKLISNFFPILGERKGQLAGTLSGGEQQMLAIGRGLMSRPKLLILDEPSLGIAPLIVEEIFQVIQRINHEGVTILLVEQNVAQALGLSDAGFVLEEGRIALSGKGRDLLANPHVKKLYLGL
ncbi:MAG: ABC transporter ATP-binding protein [Deltaproteobacteria bacterium]|nr:ABC transporter ATP-binding protein [Deltaproteobacteria bacterium]